MDKVSEYLTKLRNHLITLEIYIRSNKENLTELQFRMIESDIAELRKLVQNADHPSK